MAEEGSVMTPEIEELLAAAEAIPTSVEVDIQWVYRLHRAAEVVRRSGGDPIETGREAALGQWEARWAMLRTALLLHPHLAQTAGVMDRIEAEIPTGLPVGERWTPRMAGRVNLQLEPERIADLFACLLKCGVEWAGEDRHAVAALLSDLMIQAKAQGMTEAAWEKVL